MQQNSPQSTFFQHVNDGNYTALKDMLSNEKIDINLQDTFGETPLIIAVEDGNENIIKLLLEHGADIHQTNQNHETALMTALSIDNINIIKLFFDHGKSINLEHGKSINLENTYGYTPLMLAVSNGNEEAIKLLLDNGADINQLNQNGMTPLMLAVSNDNEEAMEMLLERGADINQPNQNGETPLMLAVSNDNEEAIQLLLDNGANINQTNQNGMTPLMLAVSNGNEEAIKLLLDNGANIHQTNQNGMTALMMALSHGNINIIKLFFDHGKSINLEHGKSINLENAYGETPLMLAVSNGNEEAIPLLLDNGADINQLNQNGMTPLMLAVVNDKEEAMKLLLDNGADINQLNNTGMTALMMAASRGHEKATKLLLDKGASIKGPTRKAIFALYYMNYTEQNGPAILNKVLDELQQELNTLASKSKTDNSKAKTNSYALYFAILYAKLESDPFTLLKTLETKYKDTLALDEVKSWLTATTSFESSTNTNQPVQIVPTGCHQTPKPRMRAAQTIYRTFGRKGHEMNAAQEFHKAVDTEIFNIDGGMCRGASIEFSRGLRDHPKLSNQDYLDKFQRKFTKLNQPHVLLRVLLYQENQENPERAGISMSSTAYTTYENLPAKEQMYHFGISTAQGGHAMVLGHRNKAWIFWDPNGAQCITSNKTEWQEKIKSTLNRYDNATIKEIRPITAIRKPTFAADLFTIPDPNDKQQPSEITTGQATDFKKEIADILILYQQKGGANADVMRKRRDLIFRMNQSGLWQYAENNQSANQPLYTQVETFKAHIASSKQELYSFQQPNNKKRQQSLNKTGRSWGQWRESRKRMFSRAVKKYSTAPSSSTKKDGSKQTIRHTSLKNPLPVLLGLRPRSSGGSTPKSDTKRI